MHYFYIHDIASLALTYDIHVDVLVWFSSLSRRAQGTMSFMVPRYRGGASYGYDDPWSQGWKFSFGVEMERCNSLPLKP